MDAARQAVGTERTGHGDVTPSFQMIADLWSIHINASVMAITGLSVSPQIHLTAFDVSEMMQDVKRARALFGDRTNIDNYVDRAGYASLSGMLAVLEVPAEKRQEEQKPSTKPASSLGFLKTPSEGGYTPNPSGGPTRIDKDGNTVPVDPNKTEA